MGARGPVPKPGSARSKAGRNTLKTTRRPTKVAPVQPPASLKAVPAALAWWKHHAPALIEAQRLRPEQAESFALLCRLKVDCDDLAVAVAKTGWTISTERGEQPNPLARLLRDARRDFVNLSREFGMTAASDARIPTEEDDATPKDEEEAHLRKFTGGRSA